MVEELIKNARVSANGRKVLSSVQKASIVLEWESSGLPCAEFCRRHGLFASQLYKWRSDAKSGAINSVFKNNNKIAEVRKEIFFQSKDKIDSILVEETKFNSNQVEILKYFNYFDNNEIFNSQKKENLKSPNNIFFVEKLGSK